MKDLHSTLPNPVSDSAVAALELSVEHALDRLGDTIVEAPRSPSQRPAIRKRRSIALAFAALVFALAIAGSLAVNRDGEESSAWAAADIAMASNTPQMLLPSSWKVTRLDQTYNDGSGEMEFKLKSGSRHAALFWVAPRYHRGYVRDRAQYAGHTTAPTSDGHTAKVFYDWAGAVGGPDWTSYAALWLANDHSMRFEAAFRGRPNKSQVKRFKALLAKVHTVSPEVWLSALPASYLLPSEIAGATKKILADVPIPPGFNAAQYTKNLDSATREQLAYKVIGNLQCAWIGAWIDARRAGDRAEMKRIRKVLATYKSWKYIPLWSNPRSSEPLYMGDQYIDSLKHGGAMDIGVPGKTRDVSKDYEMGLGCKSP